MYIDLRLVINVRIDKNDLYLDVIPQDHARKGKRSTVQLRAESIEKLNAWQQALKTTISQYATSFDRLDSESEFESSMERGESEQRDSSYDRSLSRGRPSSLGRPSSTLSYLQSHSAGGGGGVGIGMKSRNSLNASRKKYLDYEDMKVAMDIKDEELIVLKRIMSEMETSKTEQMFVLEAAHEKEVYELKLKLDKVQKEKKKTEEEFKQMISPQNKTSSSINLTNRSDSALKRAGAAAANAMVAELVGDEEEISRIDKDEVY